MPIKQQRASSWKCKRLILSCDTDQRNSKYFSKNLNKLAPWLQVNLKKLKIKNTLKYETNKIKICNHSKMIKSYC